MAERTPGRRATKSRPGKGDRTIIVGKAVSNGKDKWRVLANGHIKVLTTSALTVDAIAEAKSLYRGALRRLADR